MIRIAVDGLEIVLDDSGVGPTVVFVHGFPFNRSMWLRQRRRLSGFRVIAPDLRGFGRTPPLPPFSMGRYAADLTGLLDRLGIRAAVFCGLSMGGYVLLELLRRDPSRVHGLVLISTKATPDDETAKANRNALIDAVRVRGNDALANALMPKLLAAETRKERPSVERAVRTMISSGPVPGMIGAIEAMRDREDTSEILSEIRIPCLVIAGEQDPITPASVMEEMATKVAGARFAVIPAAGHLAPIERPREVNRVLGDFLSDF
jgi:pimeloyl-ACP methyl ester carboxylesterase